MGKRTQATVSRRGGQFNVFLCAGGTVMCEDRVAFHGSLPIVCSPHRRLIPWKNIEL